MGGPPPPPVAPPPPAFDMTVDAQPQVGGADVAAVAAAAAAGAPPPPPAPKRMPLKSNSTSSVFAQSSLTDPDVDELILSMSMVLQLHMIQDADGSPKESQEVFAIFDDTNFGDDAEAEQKRKVRR